MAELSPRCRIEVVIPRYNLTRNQRTEHPLPRDMIPPGKIDDARRDSIAAN